MTTLRALPDRSPVLDNVLDVKLAGIPQRPGSYERISDDKAGLGSGVGRQGEDNNAKRAQLRWPTFHKVYPENDTGAWKKKRVTLPDGRVEWRVIRPKFRQMLDDVANGVIDGIIFYDLDRLARQPADLEDLIDLVEAFHIPVRQVSGELDLMTSSGRMIARMLVAAAEKSSADTSRRSARQALEMAQKGEQRNGSRAFGWKLGNRKLDPAEAKIVRELVALAMDGASLNSMAEMLAARGVQTALGGSWHVSTVNQILRAPRLAGIRPYYGQHHGEHIPKVNEWWLRAMRDQGSWVMSEMDPIITVEAWEALQHKLDEPSGRGNGARDQHHSYLLRGLVRCDECEHPMIGGRNSRNGNRLYVCPPPVKGGCNKVHRDAQAVENQVVGLVTAYLARKDVKGKPVVKAKPKRNTAQLEEKIRTTLLAIAGGRLTEDDGYALVGMYRDQIAEANEASLVKPVRTIDPARRAIMLADLESASVPEARKRAIIAEVLTGVRIGRFSAPGRREDPDTVVAVWG